MQIASQVPWVDPRVLLDLGGGGGGELLGPVERRSSNRAFFMRLPQTVSRLITEQLRLEQDVAAFEIEAARAKELHRAKDFAIVPDEGLARSLASMQALLERTGTVMLTCASSSLGTYLALRMLLGRAFAVGADSLAQSLTSGIRDLESARPAIALMRVAKIAKIDKPALTLILERDELAVAELPEGPTKRALLEFLEVHGDRGIREAELATPRWREDSTPLVAMLRAALRAEARDPEALQSKVSQRALDEQGRVSAHLSLPEQALLRSLATRAQRAAALRETMRSWVTSVLGMIRDIAVESDRRLRKLMPELDTTSVFFLTMDELTSALRFARRDLAPVVRARRAEYARNLARPEPPPSFIGAPPASHPLELAGTILRGVAACSGVVEGPARVLTGPHELGELLPGEILVAHATDVGWTPLFPLAAGIVTELGGALSHAAIVAREFAVPTVVNVAGATSAIRTGDRLRVDGDRGVVVRLVT